VTNDRSVVTGGVGVVEISIADKETMSMNLIFNRADGHKIRYQFNCVPSYIPLIDEENIDNDDNNNSSLLGPESTIINGPELFVYDENELPKIYERVAVPNEGKSDPEENIDSDTAENSGPEFYEPSDDEK